VADDQCPIEGEKRGRWGDTLQDIGDDSPTRANHKKACQSVIYRTNQHEILDDHEKDQVPESGLMIRGIDGDALCIDDGKMSFMYG
jgi:hypothetical protein